MTHKRYRHSWVWLDPKEVSALIKSQELWSKGTTEGTWSGKENCQNKLKPDNNVFQGGKLSEETVTIISFCGLTFLWIVNPQSGQWGECYEYYGVYYEVYVYVISAPLLHYLCRPGALFFSSLLPSSTINTISKGNLYSFICTPKRGTEGFIGQSKRFISFGPTTGDVHCTIPVRKRFQSRISNLFQTS